MKKLVTRIQAWIDLLYSSESWFWIIHNYRKILHVNPETLLMLGLTEDEILIKSLSPVSLANNISNAFQRNSNQLKLERKTSIMEAVGIVTEKLFKTDNIFNTLYQSLQIIGEAAGVDRVHYFEKCSSKHHLAFCASLHGKYFA